jgi:hypothetical protein
VLLIEDAQGGRPTREHLVHHVLEIGQIPPGALALSLAIQPHA